MKLCKYSVKSAAAAVSGAAFCLLCMAAPVMAQGAAALSDRGSSASPSNMIGHGDHPVPDVTIGRLPMPGEDVAETTEPRRGHGRKMVYDDNPDGEALFYGVDLPERLFNNIPPRH